MGEETKAAGKGGGRGDKKKDAGAVAAPAVRPQPIVLKIDLHCLSCARKVRKAIKRAPGVAADIVAGNLIVTGPADTAELKERIEARTKKSVQIVAAGAGPPEKEKKADKEKGGGGDEKKAQANKEVTLQVQVHCATCIGRILQDQRGPGVVDVMIDADKVTVKVTGTMDADALPDYLRDNWTSSASPWRSSRPARRTATALSRRTVASSESLTPLGDAGMYQMPLHYGYTLIPPAHGGPPPNTAVYDNAWTLVLTAVLPVRPPPPRAPDVQRRDHENPNACSVM